MSQRESLVAAATARSFHDEIILFESDADMRGWAYNFVLQLRGRGYEHWILLSDAAATCETIHTEWSTMVVAHEAQPLSCVFSSQPANHSGWNRWLGEGWSRRGGQPFVYPMWATRWCQRPNAATVAAMSLMLPKHRRRSQVVGEPSAAATGQERA